MATATKERRKKVVRREEQAPPLSAVVEQPKQMHRTRLQIALSDLVRHPDNRQPTPAAVDALADSMQVEGQLEPILVRPIGIDGGTLLLKYQVISGETRWLAARKLGWEFLEGDVVTMDDAGALRILAAANAARENLDPIAQAKLIRRLCDPIEKGGSGLTREAAAAMFDLQSGGAASNLVRLLELPDAWQQRVASGEVPQSYARELLLLLVLGTASEAWEDLRKSWEAYQKDHNSYDGECWHSRDNLRIEIDGLFVEHSRPVEKGDVRTYYKETGSYESHPVRFKMTPELERDLAIVEIDVHGRPRRRATNCFLYDQNQIPAIESLLARRKAKDGAVAKKADAKLSSKEQAAADAERREKAAEQLANRIEAWRAAWLRELVASRIELEQWRPLAIRIVAWQQLRVRQLSYATQNDLCLEETLAELAGTRDPWRMVTSAADEGIPARLVAHWLRVPLRDGNLHPMPDECVEDLFELMGLDLDDQWRVLQGIGAAAARERLERFFNLHNSEQLDALGRELGVGCGAAPKKAGKVVLFMMAPKIIKLPRSLRSVRKRGAR